MQKFRATGEIYVDSDYVVTHLPIEISVIIQTTQIITKSDGRTENAR